MVHRVFVGDVLDAQGETVAALALGSSLHHGVRIVELSVAEVCPCRPIRKRGGVASFLGR